MKKVSEQFEELLKDQPGIIMAKVDEHEIVGEAIASVVVIEEGKIGVILGGKMNTNNLLAIVEGVDELKEKLAMAMMEVLMSNLKGGKKE